YRGPTPRRRP
ncbi:hypothetical protein BN1723_020368, partial [Verticillium longisporum]